MRIPLRDSLSYQQSKQAVIAALSIGLVMSALQIFIDYRAEISELRIRIDNVIETANDSAFHAAYNIDETGAQQIVSGLVSNHPIVKACIIDNFGTKLGQATTLADNPPHTLERWLFGAAYELVEKLENPQLHDKAVGELRITVDPSQIADAFVQRSLVVFVSGLVRNIILGLVIFTVFYLTFTRSILKAATPILSGASSDKIELADSHRKDEIGALINAFNSQLSLIDKQNKEISEHNSNLEQLIAERTNELAQRNNELQLERKLAIEASLAKSDFLAMMSHEVRTPMNGILGMAELLEQQALNPKAKEYASSILESGRAMLSLMDSVLDYAKYENTQLALEPADFNLEKLLQSIVFLLSAAAEKKHLLLTAKVDPDVPKLITADQEKLRQIILNLVTNAIKFTHQGQVKVRAKLAHSQNPELKDNFVLQIEVQDTGIGIKQDQIANLFEPYTQANQSISEQYGGTGMGLAICAALIKRQQGKIWCESEPSQGSRFILQLPCQVAETSKSLGDDQSLRSSEILASSLTVLVVDDLAINRKLLQGQLESLGHTPLVAEGGAQAIEVLKQNKVDVVLMDLHMPGMSGLEATHRIREELHNQLPVLAITANITQEKAEECISAGMNFVLNKPLNLQKLGDALAQAKQHHARETISNQKNEDSPLLDLSILEQHKQALGMHQLGQLLEEARGSAERRVNNLMSTPTTNFKEHCEQAHAVAGLCANFGLIELGNVVDQIETLAENQDATEIEQLKQDLPELLNKSFAQVDQFCNKQA